MIQEKDYTDCRIKAKSNVGVVKVMLTVRGVSDLVDTGVAGKRCQRAVNCFTVAMPRQFSKPAGTEPRDLSLW